MLEPLGYDCTTSLLGAGVLGDGLGALRHGVLRELSGEEQADGGLDFAGCDGGTLVVVGQTGSLSSDALKDVVHERVHDGHGFGAHTGVGVDLLQHLVDVRGVGFLPLLSALLAVGTTSSGLLAGLFGGLARGFGWHFLDLIFESYAKHKFVIYSNSERGPENLHCVHCKIVNV